MFVPQWDGQICSLGYDLADWIEAYCCHGPGDVQGEPVTLDAEWLAFIVAAYEIDPRTGRRKVDRAVLSRPKGRAKSELAAFIAVAEAFAPTRFDGWNADGQPIGRPVVSPIIKCLATEETQAGNTFQNAAFIVCDYGKDAHPEVFGGASGVRQVLAATSIYLPHGGEMMACTSGAASKDGGKETFVVPDETHLYVTNELRAMYATVARNCGKRKAAEPWMLQTTTAYEVGQDSIAETVLTSWRDGKLPNQAHWLVDHREAQGAVNLRDKTHTLRQLRQVYGSASAWMDLDRIYRSMLDPTECESPEVAARYFLNLPSDRRAKSAIIDLTAWAALGAGNAEFVAPSLSVELERDGLSAVIGAALTVNSQPHVEVVEDGVALDALVARLVELAVKYSAPCVVVDKNSDAARFIPDLEAARLNVVALDTKDRAAACGSMFALASSGGLSHNGDPAITQAWASAAMPEVEGARYFSRKRSAGSIAALYAVTFALHGLSCVTPVDVTMSVW